MNERYVNPWAAKPACSTCDDTRTVTVRVEARRPNDLRKCPDCGNYSDDEYERFRMDAWVKSHPAPEICEVDLSTEELAVYRRMRAEHPKVSKLTVLSWMEGQRYDPSKDPEFLKEVEIEMEKWRNRP